MHRLQPPHTTRKALRWPIFWIGTIGALSALDAWRATKDDGSTLSECTRRIFNTDDPRGREIFKACLDLGSAALLAHILQDQK